MCKINVIGLSLFIIVLSRSVIPCLGQQKTVKFFVKKPQIQKAFFSKQELIDGKLLIGKSDCFACHSPDAKLVGPSYVDIAKKYANKAESIELLSKKVIKGGSGNWGDIPMPPHSAITNADARKMIIYILSLGKK